MFILAFTVLPVVLTVNYAFTNYSGQNSGNPDSAARQPATLSADRRTVTLSGLEGSARDYLTCRNDTCAGATMVLYDEDASVPYRVKVASAQGNTFTLTAPAPQNVEVAQATRINKISYVGLANFQEIFGRPAAPCGPCSCGRSSSRSAPSS